MKLLSWNIRGCNNSLKRRLLKRKIQMENPAILFLQETKCNNEEMDILGRFFWKDTRMVVTNTIGTAVGLGVLWNLNLVSITNLCATCYMILGRFQVLGTTMRGVITNIYGPFQPSHKSTFLEEIRSIQEWVGKEYWVIGGDFNLIRSLEEVIVTKFCNYVSKSSNERVKLFHPLKCCNSCLFHV